jgi:hypothetical protein
VQPNAGPAKAKNAISVPNKARTRKLIKLQPAKLLEDSGRSREHPLEDEATGWLVMVVFCSQLVKRKRKMKNRKREKVLGVLRRFSPLIAW